MLHVSTRRGVLAVAAMLAIGGTLAACLPTTAIAPLVAVSPSSATAPVTATSTATGTATTNASTPATPSAAAAADFAGWRHHTSTTQPRATTTTANPTTTIVKSTTTTQPKATTTTAPKVTTTTAATVPATTPATPPATTPAPVGTPVAVLTPGTSWQWQIDGNAINTTVLDAVANPKKMYDIDMFATPAATIQQLHAKGIYVVCYVETGSWENYRPDAASYPASVLGNTLSGYANEKLVDIRQISVLSPIIAARFDIAKAKGCNGIEPDLDDTYNGYNTGFPLTMADQLTFNKAVADLAHARGMSIGLKNGASGGVFENAMVTFTDWALNEECNQYSECGGYQAYINAGKAVFQVEYSASGTTTASFCPADNAANFDGLLKKSSATLAALPRTACRLG